MTKILKNTYKVGWTKHLYIHEFCLDYNKEGTVVTVVGTVKERKRRVVATVWKCRVYESNGYWFAEKKEKLVQSFKTLNEGKKYVESNFCS